jgi:hypothetical protein
MRLRSQLAIVIILLSILVIPTIAFEVVSTSPAEGEMYGTRLGARIIVTFSDTIDTVGQNWEPGTGKGITLTGNNRNIAVNYHGINEKQIIIEDLSSVDTLDFDTIYTLSISGDMLGHRSYCDEFRCYFDYNQPYTTHFTTIPRTLAITESYPLDGADDVPLGGNAIRLKFSKDITRGPKYDNGITVTANGQPVDFTLGGEYGTYDVLLIQIQPYTSPLKIDTAYTVTIDKDTIWDSSSVRDALPNDYVLHFTTIPRTMSVIESSPLDGAVDVPITSNTIRLKFSEDLMPGPKYDNGITVTANGQPVAFTLGGEYGKYDVISIQIQPYPLKIDTAYTVTIDKDAVRGMNTFNRLPKDYVLQFTTEEGLKIHAYTGGHFIQTSGSTWQKTPLLTSPVNIDVTNNGVPFAGAIITSTEEPKGDQWGVTDANGHLDIQFPIYQYTGAFSTTFIAKGNSQSVESDPVTIVNVVKKSEEPRKVDFGTYTTLLISQFHAPLIAEGVPPELAWVDHLMSLLECVAYLNRAENYVPHLNDILQLTTYEYTAPNVAPAYRIEQEVVRNGNDIIDNDIITEDELIYEDATSPQLITPFGTQGTLASPAVIYITAPDGKHAGYDPTTGNLVTEFPISINNPGDEPFVFFIPNPIQGQYHVQVIGTGTGHYTLSLQTIDPEGGLGNLNTFSMPIKNNEIVDYNLVVDPSNTVSVTGPGLTPAPNVPEFPSALLPATMIIGVLGAVLFIQRTREH